MNGCRRRLLLLGVVALLLGDCSGSSSSHSLRNFFMAVSEPSPGLPEFIAVDYVDDQLISRYDSHTQRRVPVALWVRKVEKDDPQHWDEESRVFQGHENLFRESLAALLDHFHQNNSMGLHTLQFMFGCEMGLDQRPGGGFWQYAYDGKDFLCFDNKTLTWTTSMPQVEILKQKVSLLADSQACKYYLEKTCMDLLQMYLDYGNETLQRTDPPTVKVACKKGYNGEETLICQLYGFYPKKISVTWRKDGEDQEQDTFTGGVVPNLDGTYNTWLVITVDPKDKDSYRCHVEHDALQEPLDLAWEKPAFNWRHILGILGGILAACFLLDAGVFLYTITQGSVCGYTSSSRDSDQGLSAPEMLRSEDACHSCWRNIRKENTKTTVTQPG